MSWVNNATPGPWFSEPCDIDIQPTKVTCKKHGICGVWMIKGGTSKRRNKANARLIAAAPALFAALARFVDAAQVTDDVWLEGVCALKAAGGREYDPYTRS